MPEKSFDVARNIRMTQELQCQMLAQVADLFTAMHNNASKAEQTELLAKLEISLRLLAGRLGISQDGLSRNCLLYTSGGKGNPRAGETQCQFSQKNRCHGNEYP